MLTEEQVEALKPGDKLILDGLEGEWSKFNDETVIVADPTTINKFIHIEPFNDVYMCLPKFVRLEAGTHKCHCPTWDVVNFGCKCGGC